MHPSLLTTAPSAADRAPHQPWCHGKHRLTTRPCTGRLVDLGGGQAAWLTDSPDGPCVVIDAAAGDVCLTADALRVLGALLEQISDRA